MNKKNKKITFSMKIKNLYSKLKYKLSMWSLKRKMTRIHPSIKCRLVSGM